MQDFLMIMIFGLPLYAWLSVLVICVGMILIVYVEEHYLWRPIWVVLYPSGGKSQPMPKHQALRLARNLNCLIMRIKP